MAKVIKDRVTGLSKGYGFVKYSDISQANQAIASMNGYRLDGRVIAVRVAGKPPPPTVPPGPPAAPVPAYPGANQTLGGYASQQMASGGPIGSAPPGSYISASAPWGPSPPPPPPPPYASYAPPPPPPGSNMYSSFPVQQMGAYGVQYPTPPQNIAATEAQQSYSGPVGLHPQNNAPSPSPSSNVYGNTIAGTTPNTQNAYPSTSMSYPSYYAVPPPPLANPSGVEQQSFASAPWSSKLPTEQSQQAAYGTDPEYDKFMAEMK